MRKGGGEYFNRLRMNNSQTALPTFIRCRLFWLISSPFDEVLSQTTVKSIAQTSLFIDIYVRMHSRLLLYIDHTDPSLLAEPYEFTIRRRRGGGGYLQLGRPP